MLGGVCDLKSYYVVGLVLTFAVWNRVAAGNSLRNLNYFMAVQIINPETQYVMRRALQQYNIAEVPAWPGTDFQFAVLKGKELEMEAALALLGMSLLTCTKTHFENSS